MRTRISPIVALAVALVTIAAPNVSAYSLNFYDPNKFAYQETTYYCVAASAQTWINHIRGTTDKSRATQDIYFVDGTKTGHELKDHPQSYGIEPRGWALILWDYNKAGFGFQ